MLWSHASTLWSLHVLQRGAEPAMSAEDVVMTIWAAGFIVFVVSWVCSGYTAKRINNIHNPTYSKAFLATFLKGLISLTAFAIFGFYLQAPWYVALLVAYSLVPMAIYKIVFSTIWMEAALIWFVALIMEGLVGYGLIFAGLIKWADIVGAA